MTASRALSRDLALLVCSVLMVTSTGGRAQDTQSGDPQGPPEPAAAEGRESDEGAGAEPVGLIGIIRMLARDAISRRRIGSTLTAPSSVTVVPDSILRRTGARQLSDALRLVPGVEVQRLSSTESSVNVRGYNDASTAAQGILARIDGRQVYNEFLGNVLWDTLPVAIEDVARIEVLRGPGSFVLGPHAMHGAVDIVTRSPLEYAQDEVELSAAAGSYDSSRARVVHVRRGESSGLKTTLRWGDTASFERAAEDSWEKKSVEVRYAAALDADGEDVVDLTFGHADQHIDLLIPSVPLAQGSVPLSWFASDLAETFAKADLRFGGFASDDDEFRATVSWTGFDAELSPDRVYRPFDLDLDTVDAEVVHSQTFAAHEVTGGLGIRYATFRTEDDDIALGRHSTNLSWAFAQDSWRLSDEITVTGGLRVDRHSEAGTHLSPRIAAVWQIDEGNAVRASFGTGFRNPSLRELWFDMPIAVQPGVTGRIVGNRDLDAERMRSFEIGWRGQREDEWNASVTAFYNLVDGLVTFGDAGPLTVAPQNTDDERAYGFEVDGHLIVSSPLGVFANYSFAVRENRDTGARNPLAPRHKANAGVLLDARGGDHGFHAMVWTHWFDRTEFYGAAIDGYVLVNASLYYDFELGDTDASAFVEGFNVLDAVHREHAQGEEYGALLTAGLSVRF